ncbi:hypothetical protein JW948_04605 [bacterium]|nr:hypothetical protein [bacterium]
MESSIWFVLTGLAVFVLHRIRHGHPFRMSWLIDLIAGGTIGFLIGWIRPVEFGTGPLPLWLTACMGGLTALMLWYADYFSLFTRTTMQYSIVVVLSLVHAGIGFGLYRAAVPPVVADFIFPGNQMSIFVQFLFISAISFVGFSIPARLWKGPGEDSRNKSKD